MTDPHIIRVYYYYIKIRSVDYSLRLNNIISKTLYNYIGSYWISKHFEIKDLDSSFTHMKYNWYKDLYSYSVIITTLTYKRIKGNLTKIV